MGARNCCADKCRTMSADSMCGPQNNDTQCYASDAPFCSEAGECGSSPDHSAGSTNDAFDRTQIPPYCYSKCAVRLHGARAARIPPQPRVLASRVGICPVCYLCATTVDCPSTQLDGSCMGCSGLTAPCLAIGGKGVCSENNCAGAFQCCAARALGWGGDRPPKSQHACRATQTLHGGRHSTGRRRRGRRDEASARRRRCGSPRAPCSSA